MYIYTVYDYKESEICIYYKIYVYIRMCIHIYIYIYVCKTIIVKTLKKIYNYNN